MANSLKRWPLRKVGELFEIQQGKAISPLSRDGSNKLPFLRTTNVLWNRIVTDAVDTMSFSQDEIERLRLRPADLLVCEGGDIGRAAVWNDELPGCLYQNHVHRLRSTSANIDPWFMAYWFRAAFTILGTYNGAGNRTTIPNLSSSRLQQFDVPVPPLHEQRAISAILSKIQKSIDVQTQVVATLKALKAATMAKVFRDGLRGEPLKPTEYGPVPDSWRIEPLDDTAEVQTGVTKGRDLAGEDTAEVPYLRVANVQDGHLDLREMKTIAIRRSEIERFRLRAGDVVLTEGGDFDKLGRGFIWRGEIDLCVHQNHIFAIRPDSDRLTPEFLAYQAQSPYGKSYFLSVAHKTTNLACINSTKLKAFPVLLPTIEEQNEIVSVLSAIDEALLIAQKRSSTTQELFESTLNGLMDGTIRCPD